MYWLDNNTGISTAPTPPAVISLTKKFFTNGGLGEQPSIPEDFWFNMVQEELLGVLTMAGITPVKSDLNQVAKAIQSIAFSAYPVGAPIPWPLAVPPSGFLNMTGQSFSAATYPMLAIAYPALVLPDLRGRFIRAWDNSKGLDPARALLSLQADQNKSHTHTTGFNANTGVPGDSIGKLGTGAATSLVESSSSGGNEARPVNIAFNYIVRAA